MRYAALIPLALSAGVAHASIIGSPTIDRALVDATNGLSLVYRGGTQPYAGDGVVAETFSVYSRGGGAGTRWVTPFLLEITGADQFTIVAIGTSRDLAGTGGELDFAFDTIAGDATTEPGKTYSFGYYNGAVTADGAGGTTSVPSTTNNGAIPFDGYDDFSDLWSYAFAGAPTIGTVYGTGGVSFDPQSFAGRIYSAQLSFIPAPAGATLLLLAGGCTARRRR